MRLLAIVPHIYDTSPSQRFRLEQWDPLLRARGVEIDYCPFADEELNHVLHQQGNAWAKIKLIGRAMQRRAETIRRVRDYDAVYLMREAAVLGPPLFERWIHSAGVPMIFDFDDAVFVPYVSPSNGYLSYLKFPGKTRTICQLATHVMAGNPYLAEYAGQVNSQVTVIPTTIDTEKYRAEKRRGENDPPIIGWSGSFSTVQHLDTLRTVLHRLAERERFRLRVIGTPQYDLPDVDVESLPWRSATELDDLGVMDIGVMPLPDDQWSKGKCGLKALQYMALGIPTICSPVGVNSEIIQDGENGFLAATEEEWVEKLSLLLRSPELRQRLGEAGRATVEQKYSALAQAPRVFKIIQAAVNSRSRPDAAQGQIQSVVEE